MLLLELLHHHSLDTFILPETTAVTLSDCMVDGPAPISAWNAVCLGQCRPHGDRVLSRNIQHPCKNAEMLFLDSGMKALKGSTTVLCIDGDVRIFECQCQSLPPRK